ncbi:hypothetical protein F5B19DRAFT_480891 [Rostrohypoxylon terebratum]|nr:hypothetical protein F5B19DRAFT_480891 [Rostrohypoxylon terebratum]
MSEISRSRIQSNQSSNLSKKTSSGYEITTLAGKFVNLDMMKVFLHGEFDDDYKVKIRYNQCTIETRRPLSQEDIRQFSKQPISCRNGDDLRQGNSSQSH